MLESDMKKGHLKLVVATCCDQYEKREVSEQDFLDLEKDFSMLSPSNPLRALMIGAVPETKEQPFRGNIAAIEILTVLGEGLIFRRRTQK